MGAGKQGSTPRMDRRTLLVAGGAALLLAGCGKDAPKDSAKATSRKPARPQRPNRPVSERPPGAKTTRRVRPPAQASALRHRGPLPSELQAYVLEKHRDGTLVKGRRNPVLHHPVVCKDHLPRPDAAPPPTRIGPAASGEPRIHQRYADAILYALVRAEPAAGKALGIALVFLATWPVSARFADFALSAIRASGREPDEASVTAALQAAGSTSAASLAPKALRALQDREARRRGPR